METIQTPITDMFGIKYPILLAGMNVAAGPELAAAVSNAGGLGIIGGHGYTPTMLTQQIEHLKQHLRDPNLPWGIDLLLPKVGGNSRKTNYDYQDGKLPELIQIIIDAKATVFVSAVGVPPKDVVDKLHAANIICCNMVGHPKHVKKALEVGMDVIIAQGGEGGGHTGDIPTSLLIPAVVDVCRGHYSPLTKRPIACIAAGGIYDGRGLAMALSLGADGAWVGTRFICSKEAGAPPRHQQAVVGADYDSTIRTLIFTGRPLRVIRSPYIMDWEINRAAEIKDLTSKGILPLYHDVEQMERKGQEITIDFQLNAMPLLMGQAAGAIKDILSAEEIINSMMSVAIDMIKANNAKVRFISKL